MAHPSAFDEASPSAVQHTAHSQRIPNLDSVYATPRMPQVIDVWHLKQQFLSACRQQQFHTVTPRNLETDPLVVGRWGHCRT
eukprot:scaffold2475_cov66-Phaeocystis_antarctica.AAC.2